MQLRKELLGGVGEQTLIEEDEMDKDTEAFYDSEIAPALADLAKRCTDRGMSFVAAVE